MRLSELATVSNFERHMSLCVGVMFVLVIHLFFFAFFWLFTLNVHTTLYWTVPEQTFLAQTDVLGHGHNPPLQL